ncbi:MAG: hypothetical protein EU532_08380 [Promethearchaeota archaeon]|nr:MAG: hypothetical protein EU532_08380 [Candidatus Lokiarchaeota archaeon]
MDLTPNFLVILTLEAIYVIVQLFVAIFLLFQVKKTKLKNLWFLIAFFLLNSLEIILIIAGVPYIIFLMMDFLSNIFLLFFTKTTFYRQRKSIFLYLLVILIILKVLDFALKIFYPLSIPQIYSLNPSEVIYYYFYLIIISAVILASYPWLGYSSLRYYKRIFKEPIAPWIKTRYLIVGISSLIISLNSIFYLLIPVNSMNFETPTAFLLGVLILTTTLIFSFGNLVAWTMPKWLKRYLAKNYIPSQEEMEYSEEELMELIKKQLKKE